MFRVWLSLTMVPEDELQESMLEEELIREDEEYLSLVSMVH